MRNQKPWPFDAVNLMVLSASGFQSLPTILAWRPSLDSPTQVQACTRSTHFLHLFLSLSSFTTYFSSHTNGYFSTLWEEAKGEKKHSMMSLSSNLNVIMQMSFSWSMQQYEHVESTLTVITYIHSRSCLQWMFITAEPFDSMRVPAFKFLTHASESCRVFINLKGKSGK